MDIVFTASIDRQHREAKPLMDNLTHIDDRLPPKSYVWGVNIGGDASCWSDDYVIENCGLINATVGGQALVVA